MNRQYIGARYVPFFGGEWDINKSFEYLTIVTHNGNSYTSRKNVPVNIEITNDEYWVLTGNYNAQVNEYYEFSKELKNEVDKVVSDVSENSKNIATNTNAIKKLKNRLCVVIGDSYTTNDPNSGGVIYPMNFGELLKDNNFVDEVYSYGVNGARYDTTSNSNFKKQLQDASNDSSFNNDDVKVIIIEGGQNERFGDYTETVAYYNKLYNYVKDTINYAKNTFKNAKIYCVPIFWNGKIKKSFEYDFIWNAIYTSAMDNGASIDKTSLFWGLGANYTWGLDNMHPTYDTLKKIVNKCGNLLNGSENKIDTSYICLKNNNNITYDVIENICDDSIILNIKMTIKSAIESAIDLMYIYPGYSYAQSVYGTVNGVNTLFTLSNDSTFTGVLKCDKRLDVNDNVQLQIVLPL